MEWALENASHPRRMLYRLARLALVPNFRGVPHAAVWSIAWLVTGIFARRLASLEGVWCMDGNACPVTIRFDEIVVVTVVAGAIGVAGARWCLAQIRCDLHRAWEVF